MPVPTLSASAISITGLVLTATLSSSGCTIADLTGIQIVTGEDTDARITSGGITGTTLTLELAPHAFISQTIHLGITSGCILASDTSPIAPAILNVTNNSTVVFGSPSDVRAFSGDGTATLRWRGPGRGDVLFLIYSSADNYTAVVTSTRTRNYATIGSLTNGHEYNFKVASQPFSQVGSGPISTKIVAPSITPSLASTQEDLWAAIINVADNNYDLSQRFPSGIFSDRAEIGEALPVLLAEDVGGETEETTEDAVAEYLVSFNVWAQTDTEVLKALDEIIRCYRNQPLTVLTLGSGALDWNDVTQIAWNNLNQSGWDSLEQSLTTFTPLPGHFATILEGRPHKMKEEDETYGTIWRGIVTLRFFVTENSVSNF